MSFGSPPAAQYFEKGSDERPFVPLVDTLAASINQVPPEIFHTNATQSANSRQSAYRLFEHDAVCTTLDRTLLCDILDAPVEWSDEAGQFVTDSVSGQAELNAPSDVADAGRAPVVLDVSERLVSMLDDVTIVGGLPGPVATFNQLLDGASIDANREANELIRAVFGDLARAYGRAGVDAFLITELASSEQSPADIVEVDVTALEMLGNVAEFFGVPVLFVPEGYDVEVVGEIAERTEIDAVFLDSADPTSLADRFPDIRVGGGITPELLNGSVDVIESTVRSIIEDAPTSVFLGSGTEIPPEVHPSKLQAVYSAAEAAAY